MIKTPRYEPFYCGWGQEGTGADQYKCLEEKNKGSEKEEAGVFVCVWVCACVRVWGALQIQPKKPD